MLTGLKWKWQIKLLLLAVVAFPAFTGYPLGIFDQPVIDGLTRGWIGYGIVTHIAIGLILGALVWAGCLAIAVAIVLPVVFGGAGISYLFYLTGLGDAAGPAGYSGHYVGLCVTMLTVIPLANGLISVVPVHEVEKRLLMRTQGVYRREKAALMFIRVFIHIVFFVIPNILEVVREERFKNEQIGDDRYNDDYAFPEPIPIRYKIGRAIRMLVYLGVEGICASIQYIPLWAEEIARLPDRRSPGKSNYRKE